MNETLITNILPALNKCQRNWIDDSVTQSHIDLLLNVANGTPTKQNVNFFKVIAVTHDNVKKQIFDLAHSEGIELDTDNNLMPNATELLYLNKEFIQKQVTGWIKSQISQSIPPFENFVYEEFKCHRDVGFIVEALIYDLRFQTNEKTRMIAQSYYSNNQVQVRRFAENAAHQYMKSLINDYILQNVLAPIFQNSVSQIIRTNKNAEPNMTINTSNLMQGLIDTIQLGLAQLPVYIPGITRQTGYKKDNFNTQVLAPLLLIWCRNTDKTYERIQAKEWDTDLKWTHHVSLNVGISSGAVATAAQLLGYKTGFCGCFNPTEVQNLLHNKLGITSNNFPEIMLGIGMPEVNIDTNICVNPIGKKYIRRRQPLTRANVVTI